MSKIEENTPKASIYLEEIKVRWKKASLESCPLLPCIVNPPPAFTCGTSTISDIDGNKYNTVLIGKQCWTKENLKVSRYNNGDLISLDSTRGCTGTSASWNGLTFRARSIYGNDLNNLINYGYLYNWCTGVRM